MDGKIPYNDFAKVELRVGEIKKAEPHPNADKLFVMSVDLGEEEPRTIVAGLRKHYSAEELEGKKAIFVINLEPVMLRGVKSDGMILAAVSGDESSVVFLEPEKDMAPGSKIR